MTTLDARLAARRGSKEKDMDALEEDAIIQIQDLKAALMPDAVKASVFQQLISMLTSLTVTGSLNPMELTRTPVAMLSAGPSTSISAPMAASNPDSDAIMAQLEDIGNFLGGRTAKQVMEIVINIFGGFDGLTPDEQNARALVMKEVANGTQKVGTDGKLEIEQKLSTTQQQLSDAKTELSDLRRAADPFITVPAGVNTADWDKRKKGMQLIANGTTRVNNDGSPVLPAPDARVAVLEGFLDEIRDNTHPSRFNANNPVIEGDKISEDAMARITK